VTRFFSLCALLGGGLTLLLFTPALEAASGKSDGHKIIYLGDRGPILIELDLHIDGKPLRIAHEALMRKLFDYLDRDGDGVLSAKEAAAVPSAMVLSNPLLLARGRFPGNPQRIRTDSEGRVTRAALAAFYRQTGLPPLKLSGGPVGPTVFRLVGAPEEASAEKLTDRLFDLLDTDKDGKLSRKELEAAPRILGKLDIDEDEMLTTAEVMGQAGGTDSYGVAAFVVLDGARSGNEATSLYVVADGRQDAALGRALLQRYARKGEKSVPASALGLSKAALSQLDPEGNGALSVDKLARFGTLPADVTLTVHLGSRGGQPLVSRKGDRPLPAGVKIKVSDEGVALQLGRSRLDIAGTRSGATRVQINVRDQIKNLFRRTDRDNKGYLERKDVGRGNPFFDSFDLIDRDGDGKITEKELLAWYDDLESLRKMVNRSCVSISVSNEGRGLFELLDTNRDGKLSVRELRDAPKLLERLAASRDGLTREDVPRHHRASLALGPNGGQNPQVRQVIAVRNGRDLRGVRATPERGPLWFRKMDRNRDGDVSRNEFLGTDEQFKMIDTDGDGLISVEEAEAYDKRQPDRERPARQRRNSRDERRERQ
jgi:Ca2+-binding EF-hand superfamily protein